MWSLLVYSRGSSFLVQSKRNRKLSMSVFHITCVLIKRLKSVIQRYVLRHIHLIISIKMILRSIVGYLGTHRIALAKVPLKQLGVHQTDNLLITGLIL